MRVLQTIQATAERDFPLLDDRGGYSKNRLPWSLLAPHDKQAKANHYQTLQQLAQRGGLTAREALAVITDQPVHAVRDLPIGEVYDRLRQLVREHLGEQE